MAQRSKQRHQCIRSNAMFCCIFISACIFSTCYFCCAQCDVDTRYCMTYCYFLPELLSKIIFMLLFFQSITLRVTQIVYSVRLRKERTYAFSSFRCYKAIVKNSISTSTINYNVKNNFASLNQNFHYFFTLSLC